LDTIALGHYNGMRMMKKTKMMVIMKMMRMIMLRMMKKMMRMIMKMMMMKTQLHLPLHHPRPFPHSNSTIFWNNSFPEYK
jgi:hypothetical protein